MQPKYNPGDILINKRYPHNLLIIKSYNAKRCSSGTYTLQGVTTPEAAHYLKRGMQPECPKSPVVAWSITSNGGPVKVLSGDSVPVRDHMITYSIEMVMEANLFDKDENYTYAPEYIHRKVMKVINES